MKDTKQQLAGLTVALHWLIGITIIVLIAMGMVMEGEIFYLYPIHKSIGMLLFVLILVRVGWRIANGWPAPVSDYPAYERVLAKIVHWLLIIGTVLMPISGMVMSVSDGQGLAIFGVEFLAAHPDPNNPNEFIALNETVADIALNIHGAAGTTLAAAILIHIAGALKHHIIDKDGTLRRMFGVKV